MRLNEVECTSSVAFWLKEDQTAGDGYTTLSAHRAVDQRPDHDVMCSGFENCTIEALTSFAGPSETRAGSGTGDVRFGRSSQGSQA